MKRVAKLMTCTFLAASLAACAGMSERDRDTVVGAGVGTAIGAGVTGDVLRVGMPPCTVVRR